MKKFLTFLLTAVIIVSCKKGDTGPQGPAGASASAPAPIACFTVDDSALADSLHLFTFHNCSQNAIVSEWDFGDNDYMTFTNPTHVYGKRGNFKVRLTVYNVNGITDTISKTVTVGYYSLIKYEIHQLYPSLIMPIITSFYNSGPNPFNFVDTLHQSDLPFTRLLPDDPIYDFTINSTNYWITTTDSTGLFYIRALPVSYSSITNNKTDMNAYISVTDTSNASKLTLYYKVIYR